MAYAHVDVLVDGALEDSTRFHDETMLDEYVNQVEEEARHHGYPTEIYILFHEHEDHGDVCECVQYVTDHNPAYEFNTPQF